MQDDLLCAFATLRPTVDFTLGAGWRRVVRPSDDAIDMR